MQDEVAMGYQDRGETLSTEDPRAALVSMMLGTVVRAVGLIVLFVGLWVGIKVILEAWALYEEPQRIVRFADAIQKHSNIDGVLSSLTSEQQAAVDSAQAVEGGSFRLSYFAAWFIVLLLILVVGLVSMSAITTGGQLTLYDMQRKRQYKAIVEEVRRMRDG
jgi:hypothetical protein